MMKDFFSKKYFIAWYQIGSNQNKLIDPKNDKYLEINKYETSENNIFSQLYYYWEEIICFIILLWEDLFIPKMLIWNIIINSYLLNLEETEYFYEDSALTKDASKEKDIFSNETQYPLWLLRSENYPFFFKIPNFVNDNTF